MKLLQKGFWLLLICLLSARNAASQDLAFSQFHHTPFLTNPATLVQDHFTKVFMNFRNQSLESGENISTPMLSFSYPLGIRSNLSPKFGLGFSFINDNATDLLTTNGGVVSGAYNFMFGSKVFLSLGLQAGLFQRRIDISKITTDNQFLFGFFDPDADINEDLFNASVSYFTASTGLMLVQKDFLDRNKAFLGFSYNNFNKPNASFLMENASPSQGDIPQNFTFIGGVNFYQGEQLVWKPNFRWINRLGENLLNLGSKVQFNFLSNKDFQSNNHIDLGLWYNTNKAIIMAAEFHQPKYWIALSYDLPTSNNTLTISNNGIIELSLGLRFPRKSKSPVIIEDSLQVPWDELHLLIRRDSLIYEDVAKALAKGRRLPTTYDSFHQTHVDKIRTNTIKPNAIVKDTILIKVRRIEKNTKDTLTVKTLKKIGTALTAQDKLTLNKKIRFRHNSNELAPVYQQNLDNIAKLLLEKTHIKVMIVGHTCDVGDNSENLKLSRVRAESVKKYLIKKGIAEDRLSVLGMGTAFPLVPNTNEGTRNINRRVEFKILPN